ncbi:hypothetical protein BY458DRAFT_151747 [Sporodiniella umbellata]|nr:hypothetical protein BY458DRAFT_151747 [Sporodiniella umbellata]
MITISIERAICMLYHQDDRTKASELINNTEKLDLEISYKSDPYNHSCYIQTPQMQIRIILLLIRRQLKLLKKTTKVKLKQ